MRQIERQDEILAKNDLKPTEAGKAVLLLVDTAFRFGGSNDVRAIL
jgi:hypothetical protein